MFYSSKLVSRCVSEWNWWFSWKNNFSEFSEKIQSDYWILEQNRSKLVKSSIISSNFSGKIEKIFSSGYSFKTLRNTSTVQFWAAQCACRSLQRYFKSQIKHLCARARVVRRLVVREVNGCYPTKEGVCAPTLQQFSVESARNCCVLCHVLNCTCWSLPNASLICID